MTPLMKLKRKIPTEPVAISDLSFPEPVVTPSSDDATPAAFPIAVVGRLHPDTPLRREPSASVDDLLGGSRVDDGVSEALRRRAGSGEPLPEPLAVGFGTHFRHNFSSVRIHRDPEAGAIAGALQSQAFTHGNDVYFAPGKFRPGAREGQQLIAHELGHVVAQRTGADPAGRGPGLTVGRALDPAETAADRAADGAMAALRRTASIGTERQSEPDVPRPAWSALRSADSGRAHPTRDAAEHRAVGGVIPALRRSVATTSDDRSTTIRRKFSKTSADINALRSNKGVKKGERTRDTLHGISRLLDAHQGLKDPGKVIHSLRSIEFLCDRYLDEHFKDKELSRILLVREIRDEAMRDISNLQAQQRYLNDLRQGSAFKGKGLPAVEKTTTPMTQTLAPTVATGAHSYNAMRDQTFHPMNPAAEVVSVIKEAGLTEAEIAAIKIFTANDYLYLNPAIANDEVWLGNQTKSVQDAMDANAQQGRHQATVDTKKLIEEGTAHAGVIMAALAKMTPMKGKVYRGARMSQKEFSDTYEGKAQVTFDSFVSSAIAEGPARSYARGSGSKKPNDDQTVSVVCIIDVDDARDVHALSEIQSEKEWLLLPGATYAITRIEDDAAVEVGRPAATAGKIVHMKQISKPSDKFGGVREVSPGVGAAAGAGVGTARYNWSDGRGQAGPQSQATAGGRQPGRQRAAGRPQRPARGS